MYIRPVDGLISNLFKRRKRENLYWYQKLRYLRQSCMLKLNQVNELEIGAFNIDIFEFKLLVVINF